MKKQLDTKQLTAQATQIIAFLKKYAVLIFVLIALGIFGFLVLRVRTLVSTEPSEAAIEEKIGQAKPITIDSSAVAKIQKLQATNVEVKALFDNTRDNPFQE